MKRILLLDGAQYLQAMRRGTGRRRAARMAGTGEEVVLLMGTFRTEVVILDIWLHMLRPGSRQNH